MESIIFLVSVFLAGILSFFSPCIFPLLPVYAGILLDDQGNSKSFRFFGRNVAWSGLIRTLCFVAGISLIFFILGFGAGFLGHMLYADWFRYAMGTVIILLGLHQMEILHFNKLEVQKTVTFKQSKSNHYLSAFLLGITFSFGWTPCIGPVLSSVLALAASGGNGAWQGAVLTLVYTLGMALPFILLALASGWIMPYFSKLKPYDPTKKNRGSFDYFDGIIINARAVKCLIRNSWIKGEKMKKVIFAGLSLMSLFLLIACGEKETKQTSSPKQPTVQQIAVGKDAPDFTLQSMDGKEVKLSDYKGKKVYLKFWASWCGPCKKSMPELMELAAKQDRDFEILSVIAPGLQGEKTVQDFPKWFQEQGYKDIPVLYDTQATTFQAYQIRSIPTEYLIDSQGKIGKIQFGAISNADAEAAFKEMK